VVYCWHKDEVARFHIFFTFNGNWERIKKIRLVPWTDTEAKVVSEVTQYSSQQTTAVEEQRRMVLRIYTAFHATNEFAVYCCSTASYHTEFTLCQSCQSSLDRVDRWSVIFCIKRPIIIGFPLSDQQKLKFLLTHSTTNSPILFHNTGVQIWIHISFYRAACIACNGTRSSTRKLSNRPSVCQTRDLWQNEWNVCQHSYITWKIIQPSFVTRRIVGGGDPFHLKFWVKLTL